MTKKQFLKKFKDWNFHLKNNPCHDDKLGKQVLWTVMQEEIRKLTEKKKNEL